MAEKGTWKWQKMNQIPICIYQSINQKNLTWPRQQAAATRPGGESD